MEIEKHSGCGRDAFREEGGLDFLVEFLFSTDNTIFLEHSLKTLAFVIDENVLSQMYISKRSVFEVLQTILKNQSFPSAVLKNALVLISTILYHNSTAQNLVFEIGLLQDLLSLYEYYAQGVMINSSCMTSNLDNCILNLWMSTNSALCFIVNNPQNEKNQDISKAIFPIALKILELSSNSIVMNSTASFLLLTISDNAKCQDYFSSCDGFLVLKRCFQKYFDTLLLDMKVCNGITGKGTYQAINNIIDIISSASLDHEKNAAISGEIGILSMMIKLLFLETFDIQLKTKIVLCLGHCIGACCSNKSYVLETENFDAFLKRCLQLEDAELSSACKYLLQVCLVKKELLDSNLDHTRCDPEYFNDALMETFVSNGMQNSAKVPSIRSPSLKVKNCSRSLEKANSSSSIKECASQTIYRKRKTSQISGRSLNKLSIKEESLSDSKNVHCDFVSDQQFSPRNKKYSNSFHSYATSDFSKYKYCKKEMSQISPSDHKFSKQDIVSNKKSFTDFLTNETKCSTTKFKNQNFLKTDISKISPDQVITDWHMHNTKEVNESVKISTNHPTKTESISGDNNSNSFLPYSMKFANQNSKEEKCPRLFKKKKKKISLQKSASSFSGSSTEYSFTPFNVKNFKGQENESGSRLGYYKPCQSKINFSETSKNSRTINDNYQKNFRKCNADDKLQAPKRKFLFSSNTENQVIKDQLSAFSFKHSPTISKCDLAEKNSFSRGKKMLKTDKENILDLATFTGASFQHEKRLTDSGFSSSRFSQYSRRSNIYLNDCYQSGNWTGFPQTSRIFENPYERKRSWSCSSTGTYSESFNSSRYVQVIVVPKKPCEQHGLSSSAELMEVISLEDITQC